MTDTVETELIVRLKGGDVSAFNLLTRKWYEKILSFLYRILGNMDDAEDACQKTFIAVYSMSHQLNDCNKFSTWLYQIANNYAIDQLRHRKKLFRRNGSSEDPEYDLAADPPDLEQVDMASGIDSAALRHLFEKTMRTIPNEQRVVIVMKLYQDLKFSEIAQILEVPINTVKTRMYTGLRVMKETLNKDKMIKEILKDAM